MTCEEVLCRNFTHISDGYKDFAAAKDKCRQCSIFSHYQQVVQSEGNGCNPTFMLIGEGAGEEEVLQRRPFVGRAGQRLRVELRKHSHTFNKNTCIISNILPCRPQGNLFPTSSEFYEIKRDVEYTVKGSEVINHCANLWLRREIIMLQPPVLILLGAKALHFIRGDSGITNHRGSWKFVGFSTKDGVYKGWTVATYHPSYVLRCQNDTNKNHIVKQFEDDFVYIEESWNSLVSHDPQMKMSWDEWKREVSLSSGQKILNRSLI